MTLGQVLAIFGAAMALILAGMGSSKGVGLAGETAAGVITENPDVAGKMIVLQALPATQGIYGFLIAIIVMLKVGLFGGSGMVEVSTMQGLAIVGACLPIAIVGYYSSIKQGKVSAAGMLLTGQRAELSGRGIVMAVMVETYAVFALLVSFLLVNAIQL